MYHLVLFFNCIIFKATTIWVRTAVISIKQRVNLSRFLLFFKKVSEVI